MVARSSSSNIYNQSLLASLIANKGKRRASLGDKSERQHGSQTSGRSGPNPLLSPSGVADVAIANTYYVGLLANSEDPKDKKWLVKSPSASQSKKAKERMSMSVAQGSQTLQKQRQCYQVSRVYDRARSSGCLP